MNDLTGTLRVPPAVRSERASDGSFAVYQINLLIQRALTSV